MLVRRTNDGTETHRNREYTEEKCAECGGHNLDRRTRMRYLYRYWIQVNGELLQLQFDDPHLFCDSWCRQAFYRRQ